MCVNIHFMLTLLFYLLIQLVQYGLLIMVGGVGGDFSQTTVSWQVIHVYRLLKILCTCLAMC